VEYLKFSYSLARHKDCVCFKTSAKPLEGLLSDRRRSLLLVDYVEKLAQSSRSIGYTKYDLSDQSRMTIATTARVKGLLI